jgi:hypothetical protein
VNGNLVTFATNSGPLTGQALPASVARCLGAGQEAFGGGAVIKRTGPNSTSDVVTLQSSYPGLYQSSSSVTPIPSGNGGQQSTQPANAYEADAVITNYNAGDTITVQSFVTCGP